MNWRWAPAMLTVYSHAMWYLSRRTLALSVVSLAAFLGMTIFMAGCSTEFDVNDEWEEIGVVYCLLDPSDSVQYVRLQRAYLNNERDAMELANLHDSIYYTDEVQVTLSVLGETYRLSPVKIERKNDGDFNSEPYFAYRTPEGFEVEEGRKYRLRITITETGYELESECRAVTSGTIEDPGSSITSLAICNSQDEFTRFLERSMTIRSGKWVKFYDMSLRFHWDEYDPSTSPDTTDEFVEFTLGKMVSVSSLNGNLQARVPYQGGAFYDYLARTIPQKDGVERRVGYLEFRFLAGGQEIYDYINVNTPSLGIVQKKPEYTNIVNGKGIFSSRTAQTVNVELDDCSIDRIVADPDLRRLGFVR